MRPSTCVGFDPVGRFRGWDTLVGVRRDERPGVGLDGCGLMEDIAHVLGAVIGDFDTDMRLICREGCAESFLLTWGELVARGAQEKPDLTEGITLAPAVTGRVLLDATTYLIESVTGELDDVKGIERRDSHPRWEVYSALGQPVLVHGARPSRDQIHSSGPWDDPSRVSGLRCR